MKRHIGFTLIEVMTVVAIIGILSAVATPSFIKYIKQDRIISTANELMSTFKMARSEAIKREKIVTNASLLFSIGFSLSAAGAIIF